MESPRTRPIFEGFFEKLFANPSAQEAPSGGVAALKQALGQQVLVLTPNDRLATRLSQAYVAWAAQSGQAQAGACAMPTFTSLTRWAQGQWSLLRTRLPSDHALAGRSQLLSAQSEWVLWQKLVSQTEGLSLLDEGGLASLAQEAYAIQRGWCMKTRELEAHAEGDQRFFVNWRAAFVAECQSRSVLPRADLLAALLALPAAAGERLTHCCWLGFSELTPAESALFQAMPKIWHVTPEQISLREFVPASEEWYAGAVAGECADGQQSDGWGQAGLCQTEDETEELHAAMAWLRERFTPDAKLALVVPDLPTRKTALERAFQSEWAPQWAPQALLELPDANLTDVTLAEWVSFSGGTALSALPIYAVVCTLANMAQGQVSLAQLAVLLTSPYIGSPPIERGARQRLLQQLQAQQLTQWPIESALEIWRAAGLEKALADCPDWVSRFEVSAGNMALIEKAGFSPTVLDVLLADWGWPGDAALDSAEYQQLKKWGGVRAQWSDMLQFRAQLAEGQEGVLNVHDSVRYLQEILDGQIFQPKSQDTPLQVLGILEALEQPFDALWFMGAEDQVLPPAARPHPLLPQSLQRHYNSLRATPGRELALARETVTAFSALTHETCFSWSSRVGNRDAAPSRLIAHLPNLWTPSALIQNSDDLFSSDSNKNASTHPGFNEQVLPLAHIAQTHAVPVADPANVRGGTGVMKTFAECPFKAFVRYRLGLDAPSVPSLGLDVVLRGVLVHAVLEAVWQRLGAQSALLSLSAEAQSALVKEKVASVLEAFTAPEGLYLGHLLLTVEAKRLQRTTRNWLQMEAKRAPFRIAGIEKALMIELSGLRLNVRLDRMDETEAGDVLVIDYKTGHTDIGHWFGKRIQAPQLPLYCVALSPQARGVLYGVVKASKPQIKGAVAEAVTVMQESKDSRSISQSPDWPAVVKTWQKTLEKSAADFVGGLAAVDPIDGTRTCERCAYASVCRIQERASACAEGQQAQNLEMAEQEVQA